MRPDKHIKTYNYCYYDYRITIIYDDVVDTFQAWLRHMDYGIAELMFECHTATLKEFKRLVELNKADYIHRYRKMHEN